MMRGAFTASVSLHLGLIAVVYFGLPNWFAPTPAIDQPVVVELVTIADDTVAAPLPVAPEPKPDPAPPPPAPEPAPAPAPEPAPEPEVAEVAPEVIEPEPEPEPESAPELAEVLPAEPLPAIARKPRAKPAAPKVVFTPKPRTKPAPPMELANFDPTRIAALLDQQAQPEAAAVEVADAPAPEPPKVISRTAALQNRPLTVSEIDAFRAQIERCWSVPAGAVDAENLVVSLRIFLNPDGTLGRAPEIVERARMERPGQEFFRAAAESAMRAVLKCEPYGMFPTDKYELWREIELKFDPISMLGRG